MYTNVFDLCGIVNYILCTRITFSWYSDGIIALSPQTLKSDALVAMKTDCKDVPQLHSCCKNASLICRIANFVMSIAGRFREIDAWPCKKFPF